MKQTKKIRQDWCVVDSKTKHIFKDLNGNVLKFSTITDASDWCKTRNELDRICFITGKKEK